MSDIQPHHKKQYTKHISQMKNRKKKEIQKDRHYTRATQKCNILLVGFVIHF